MKMNRTIQITISKPYFDGAKSGTVEVTFKVKANESTSIRKVALQALRSIAQSTSTTYGFSESISPTMPLSIRLKQSKRNNSSSFGISYKISKKGHIVFLSGYEPLSADWTYGEIRQLKKNHYISGDPKHLIIDIPDGLGSFNGEIQKLVLIYKVINIILGSSVVATPQKSGSIAEQNVAIAQEWFDMNLYSLRQIRTLIECKKSWTTQEVMNRLGVTEEIANNILNKLGYKLRRNKWKYTPGYNQDKKDEWIKMENIMEQKQQIIIEQLPLKE